jgi:LmbE family N-acetylglucosaminyl deacetylase
MVKASREGHRVVEVFGTRGEHGEVPEHFLKEGETLTQRREHETQTAAGILEVARVEFLGYVDSGMMGTPENDAPDSFWQADIEEASRRLAKILTDEDADVLVTYDENGSYGHPDHIQVHRVGVRAAEIAGTRKVYESVVDRDRAREMMDMPQERPELADLDFPTPEQMENLGVPGELITTNVDVRDYLSEKRAAMAAHASQISEASFFLALPPDISVLVWGLESYVLRGAPEGSEEDWLL